MEWFINHTAGGYPRVITGTYYYDIVWYSHLTGLLSSSVSSHTDNGDRWGCLQTIVRLPKIEQHWCSPHFGPTRAWFHKHRAGIQFINIFPSHFKCNGNLILLSSKLKWSDRYKILHIAWQLCCRRMCTIVLRYDHQQLNYSWIKSPWNLNCDGKS